MANIAKKGLTKKEIEDDKLIRELRILEQVQNIFEKLTENLFTKIDTDLKKKVDSKSRGDIQNIIKIFDEIEKIIKNDEYKIRIYRQDKDSLTPMTDIEMTDIGTSIIIADKYLDLYKQYVENETKNAKKDMININKITDDTLFLMQRTLIIHRFWYDFMLKIKEVKSKLDIFIGDRNKIIKREFNTSDMMKDYVSTRISDLLTKQISKIDIKPIASEIKKMSKEIRDLIPRTKSEHVGISMHKIRGGKKYNILWKNLFNKYNRNDLNLISNHYGLKNKKTKKYMINNLNAIILYRSGKFNKRKELNLFSKLFGINPKLYKRKKDLIHKLNQTLK